MKVHKYLSVLVGLTLFLFSEDLVAANYYINDTSTNGDLYTAAIGNDANDGQSPATPKRTLTNLLSTYDLDPGDTVFLDTAPGGHQYGAYFDASDVDGSSSNSIIFQGPTNGQIVEFSGGLTNSGFYMTNANHIVVDSIQFRAFGGAIYMTGNSSSNIIRRSTFISNVSYAIMMEAGTMVANLITSNYISGRKLAGNGIIMGNCRNSTVRFNSVLSYMNTGISGFGMGVSNLIKNNIISSNGWGIWVQGYGNQIISNSLSTNWLGINIDGSSDLVQGNVIKKGYSGIRMAWTRSNMVRNNSIYSNNAWGIEVAGDWDSVIIRNFIFRNAQRGMVVGANSGSNSLIGNNVLYQNGSGISVSNGGAPLRFVNNILLSNGAFGIRNYHPNTIWNNNLVFGHLNNYSNFVALAQSNLNLEQYPFFSNAAAGIFSLLSGSPAIDTGTTNGLTALDSEPVIGLARDIGAIESPFTSATSDFTLLLIC